MSEGYKSNLSTIRERINATYEKLDPKKIMRNNSRIRGAAPPSSWRDAHGKPVKYPKPNPVKYPKPNPARRSRKCRRKKRRKTKRNLAGCACRDYRNCDCRRRARIEMELRRLREQREQAEREERLRQENLRILDDAKQYNLKDEDGNDFTIENLEDAKIALNKYLEDEKNHKRFIQALKNERVLIEDVGVPMGIPVPTTRWQRFKNFIKRKTRKVHPVSIVPESGKRKTRRKKRGKKKQKRNLAGNPDPETDKCVKKKEVYFSTLDHVNQLPSWQRDPTRPVDASHDPYFGTYVGAPLMGYTVSRKGGRRKTRRKACRKRTTKRRRRR